jgi:hypothetical protein
VKTNLCSKVPSRGSLGYDKMPDGAQAPKYREWIIFQAGTYNRKGSRLNIRVHSRRDVYILNGKSERSKDV